MKKQRMLLGIVCLLCMLHFSGCGLFEDIKIEQTISGHLYLDCEMEPLTNYTIEIKGKDNGGFGGNSATLATVTTDENGYFYAKFEHNYSRVTMWAPQNFGILLFELDSEENLIDHDFIIVEIGRFQMKLQTQQSYTDQDTLYLNYFADGVGTKTFVGPFENNQILEDLEYRYDENFEDSIVWGLGWDDYIFASENWLNRNAANYQPYNFIPFEIGGCGTVTEVVIPLP